MPTRLGYMVKLVNKTISIRQVKNIIKNNNFMCLSPIRTESYINIIRAKNLLCTIFRTVFNDANIYFKR